MASGFVLFVGDIATWPSRSRQRSLKLCRGSIDLLLVSELLFASFCDWGGTILKAWVRGVRFPVRLNAPYAESGIKRMRHEIRTEE